MQTNEINKIIETLLAEAHSTETLMEDKLSEYAEKTSHDGISKFLKNHKMETQNQLNRLERAFEVSEMKHNDVGSPIMDAILSENETFIGGCEEGPVRDAAILVALQRIQHQEIATYGSIIALCKAANQNEVARLLQESLDEEYETDKELSISAEKFINVQAHQEAA